MSVHSDHSESGRGPYAAREEFLLRECYLSMLAPSFARHSLFAFSSAPQLPNEATVSALCVYVNWGLY